ncbi:MAG: Methionyl-tRNA synthetase [Candidatus Daviesbacteria bacterium GW2011_GWA1_41_61]|uniref:methionine--tRNA ligase n=1 Tax=Candidatus Daviesbacteria bacterium GW2011_GWA2_40_9 TaxID=1618424 RepID=A0A0G0U2V2_9BACT|nr:MAG: Methionyl-tRNA synthetase [Candidatus Daviesbacteria bacterium GW2011_GWC1_40_9]KKR83424.1 MAG: Methionyl-tRNA synthetase [Candidatus Daviesbacteria bacterium GW2011_GWA2_40_9]KKR93806.1 MAG: Methionyl-tRNA synthetase [Candidatus Daviesbacteria bacterium GW2011_GWB1_41_15]KKS15272.1 MAG: Methionyl-tRNA synthetase [Candidatus Daviesbacteria bacterium GW2011_GWA1_41_61]
MNKFFATTPIYYVNDVPHIGHTYTTIAADVLTRYHHQKGKEAQLLTGTDEHGAKIAEAAKKHGEKPKEYADKISQEFKKTWDKLNINYVRFIRTTDEDHIKIVQEFLLKMYKNGAVEEKPRLYKGLYCVPHEKFMSKDELVNGLCPDHKTAPIDYAEENYYFRLSDYQQKLEQLISEDKIKVRPLTRKNEVLGKIRQGLEDISISRANLEWGIPLPFDTSHTTYVWIDALINYYTYGSANDLWPADLHLVGKDILWFHSVIWPAMLLSIGEEPPKEVFAHGFFTINGEKMSKTIGNVIKPEELINKYGVDGTRYVLLAAFPFGEDGNFSWELFDRLYNADLANGLGNLVARVARLSEKSGLSINQDMGEHETKDFEEKIESLDFSGALVVANHYLKNIDEKISQEKPWEIKDKDKLQKLLTSYISEIVKTVKLFQPFLPQTAENILSQFSGSIKSAPPLFPRV